MPFTFSHPAIFVPLVRLLKQRVSVTGLIIGSMIPDLEYFIRMKGLSRYGHSLTGVLWFDLPLGLLVAFGFHQFLRNPLILQLPSFARKRYQHLLRFAWNRWVQKNGLIVLLSFVAGSLSHLLWDWFTHEGAKLLQGFFEEYTPVSDDDDSVIYYLFFGLNSLAGLLVLRRSFWGLPAAPLAVPRPKGFAFWSFASMTAIAVFFLRVLIGGDLPLLSYIDSAISAFLLSVVLTVAVQKFVQQRLVKPTASRAR